MRRLALLLALAAASPLAGCSTDLGPAASGLQSFRVRLLDPTPDQLGTPDSPVVVGRMTFDVEAVDDQGARFVETDSQADVYLAYSGGKVGRLSACGNGDDRPITTIQLQAGIANGVAVELPRAFGRSTVWLEDPSSHAVGSPPPIWFPQFTMVDLLTPLDLTASTATWCLPWLGRYVTVDHAGAGGKLVVDSVFGNAYTVCDTSSPYDPATKTGGFNCLYVFSYSAPPSRIVPGRVVQRVTGNLTKFNGFTELSFPLQDYGSEGAPVPTPVPLVAADLKAKDNVPLLRRVGATVAVEGTICAVDAAGDSWTKYKQFELDLGNGCDSFSDVSVELPAKVFGDLDPVNQGGRRVSLKGMLRNSSGQNAACDTGTTACSSSQDCTEAANDVRYDQDCQARLLKASCVEGICRRGSFNFWTVVPRTPADVSLQ